MRLLLLASGFLLLTAGAAEARTLDEIKSSGVLKVGTTADYRPFAIRNGDGSVEGADIAIVGDFARGLGLKVELVPTEWKSLQADFDADRFDLAVGGVTITPDRAAKGDFSVPLLEDGKRPVARCADKDRFTSIAAIDQAGVKVIVNPGAANEAFARTNFKTAPITVNPDNVSLPERIVDGSADVFVTDGIEVDLIARRHPGVLCAAAVPGPFTHLTKAWYLHRDAGLKPLADTYLTEAKVDGRWQKALDQAMH